MKYYIDVLDKRNQNLKKQMEKEDFEVFELKDWKNEKNCAFVYAPNKKFDTYEIENFPSDTVLFCGNLNETHQKLLQGKNVKYINFLYFENFAVKNSNLTSEGVLNIILSSSDKSIYENNILILGNGRVAKSCAILLDKLGARFSLCSFHKENFDANYFFTENAFLGDKLKEKIQDFDVVINTIPAKIFDEKLLTLIQKNAIFIETASIKCLDDEKAKHFEYIFASGLPQKVAPFSAGKLMLEIIKQNT